MIGESRGVEEDNIKHS